MYIFKIYKEAILLRLDKFLTDAGVATRTEAARAAREGKISVNNIIIRKSGTHVDPVCDKIIYCGNVVTYREFTYIMLNKPEGYVSSTDDPKSPNVLMLLPERLRRIGLFPCGRLDKNTVGLLLLTNNGPLSHKLLAPKNHVEKKYRFRVSDVLSAEDIDRLESGVDIGGYVTAPCRLEMTGENEGFISITEGKYHQIKLMMSAVGTHITFLERVSFGPIELDNSLERGSWRYLSENEQSLIENAMR